MVKERLEVWAEDHGIDITPEKLDHFRCSPPPLDVEWTLEEQALFGASMIEFQYHYETHASSCFHKTKRTPQAIVCRFFYPRMIQLLESYITSKGDHVVTRLLGQEYYNMCNLLWARLFKANSDFQMLLNKEVGMIVFLRSTTVQGGFYPLRFCVCGAYFYCRDPNAQIIPPSIASNISI